MGTGYVALFVSAFLASTFVPFSSEVTLITLALSEKYDQTSLLIVASTGNTLGGLFNWALGRFFLRWQDRAWFPISGKNLERATVWFRRYGTWSLLLSWAPIIGDPLTLLAGVFRTNIWLFLLLVALGKTARYALLLGLFS